MWVRLPPGAPYVPTQNSGLIWRNEVSARLKLVRARPAKSSAKRLSVPYACPSSLRVRLRRAAWPRSVSAPGHPAQRGPCGDLEQSVTLRLH